MNRKIRTDTLVFYEYVQAHVSKAKPLKIRGALLDSVLDFGDILRICEMILRKDAIEIVEIEFQKLDTVIKGAFPTTIFKLDGTLNT